MTGNKSGNFRLCNTEKTGIKYIFRQNCKRHWKYREKNSNNREKNNKLQSGIIINIQTC